MVTLRRGGQVLDEEISLILIPFMWGSFLTLYTLRFQLSSSSSRILVNIVDRTPALKHFGGDFNPLTPLFPTNTAPHRKQTLFP